MSYYNQLSNQAQGFSNYGQVQAQRGQDSINDYNIEKGEYTGAEVAHRSGLQALKTGNEMPRLMEEYFGLKPAAKKIVPALLEKTGITAKLQSAIKGTKLEGYLNRAKTATENVKAAAKAVKEGDYGKAADAITGGKASEAAASVKKFAEDTLEHHTNAAKDALTEGAGEAKNTLDRFVGKAGSQVRQIGSDAYKGLSADAKSALPKGAIDEHGIPLNPSEISRADAYKGLTTGRMKLGKDGTSIEDTLTGAGAKPGTGEGLKGGGRLTQEGGQFSFKTEGGEPYGAGASSDGSMRIGSSSAYDAQKEASLGRDFQGTPQTQANLQRLSDAKDAERGSVDFRFSTGRIEDPAQVAEREARVSGKRGTTESYAEPERASADDVAQARIPKFQARSGQNVRIRGDPGGGEAGGAAPPRVAPTEQAPPSGIKERIQQQIRENQAKARGEDTPESLARESAERSTRPLPERPAPELAPGAKEPEFQGDTPESLARESAARSTRPLPERPAPELAPGAKEPEFQGDTAESLARESAARSTTTQGGYLDSTAPMRAGRAELGSSERAPVRTAPAEAQGQGQLEAQARQSRIAQQATESDAGKGGEEAGSFIERAGATLTKDTSPISSIAEGAEGAVGRARMTDSGRSQISEDSRVLKTQPTQSSEVYQSKFKSSAAEGSGESLGKEEAVKGAETFGKTVAESEAELAPLDAAESALPGVGEVLMGLTAIGGLVKGAIKEHQEKKAMEADKPVAPATPTQQAQGGAKSGIAFSSAPVLDSSSYHHL